MIRFKEKMKSPEYAAAVSSVICGIITHMFGLVNVLHNNDDIGQHPYGYGAGVESGRWMLSVLGDFFEELGLGYNLPYVNGLIFLILIGVASGVVVNILKVKNLRSAALIGMLFSVFPTVTSTMFFRFTVVYYGIGIVLAVLSVWMLQNHRFGFPLSALCLALSLGCYQAYAPLVITLYVLLLIQYTMREESEVLAIFYKGLYYCAALIAGLLLYFLLLKICLAIYSSELSDYNGVNEMGIASLRELPRLIKEAIYTFVLLPINNYCGLANHAAIRYCYLGIEFSIAVMIGYRMLTYKKNRILKSLALGLLCAVFPISVNFIQIMCPNAYIYTMMMYAFVLLVCMPLVLHEVIEPSIHPGFSVVIRKAVGVILAALVFFYGYEANVEYTSLYYSKVQIQNYLSSMISQIRMTEGFTTDKTWAFLGKIEDPLLNSAWQNENYYGGHDDLKTLINRTTRDDWMKQYFGYTFPAADKETVKELWLLDEVSQMPCWPNEGSIKVIEDIIVIKLQNEPEDIQ